MWNETEKLIKAKAMLRNSVIIKKEGKEESFAILVIAVLLCILNLHSSQNVFHRLFVF